jgi:hypothetical protein
LAGIIASFIRILNRNYTLPGNKPVQKLKFESKKKDATELNQTV